MPDPTPHADLCAWTQSAIFAGTGADSRRLGIEIRPNARMTPAQRLAIYTDDYYARMTGALVMDHAASRAAIGAPAFDALARAFVEANPSRTPNLNLYGAEFADFVLGSGRPGAPALAALLRLERLVAQTPLIADPDPPLNAESLSHVPPERLEQARIMVRPSVSVLTLDWPVDACIRAHLAGEPVRLPAEPTPEHVQIWRGDPQVWRLVIPAPRAAILRALKDGVALGEALAGSDAAPEEVQAWFSDWMSEGIFCGVEV